MDQKKCSPHKHLSYLVIKGVCWFIMVHTCCTMAQFSDFMMVIDGITVPMLTDLKRHCCFASDIRSRVFQTKLQYAPVQPWRTAPAANEKLLPGTGKEGWVPWIHRQGRLALALEKQSSDR